MERIKIGQIWKYKTRVEEKDSRLTVLSVENDNPSGDKIVNIQLKDLKLYDLETNEILADSIDHLPITLNKFIQSVTILESCSAVELGEGYKDWKIEFEKGPAGVWDLEISDIIDLTERSLNSSE